MIPDSPPARLALDTIYRRPTRGLPTWCLFLMEHAHIERLAGEPPGSYRQEPERVYLACQHALGACLVDQYIPTNPLTMGDRGFEQAQPGATTGAGTVTLDGLHIDSPEAVVEHLETRVFPSLRQARESFDEDGCTAQIIQQEADRQQLLAPMLKTGHGFVAFPALRYGSYGYEHYFAAYALYPEVMEQDFALQADLALANNRAAARAYAEAGLPPLYRLDHDMAGSRGLLVNVRTLDRLWLPHFARCLQPLLTAGVRLLWHCDGNLMELVPRLLEVGLAGFQGFQYEAGMDYARICRMKTRQGESPLIMAGVSVSSTLPHGSPDQVRRELRWLVECGPPTGLFLGGSSSITPGVPWENIRTLVEGLRHYREHGR